MSAKLSFRPDLMLPRLRKIYQTERVAGMVELIDALAKEPWLDLIGWADHSHDCLYVNPVAMNTTANSTTV